MNSKLDKVLLHKDSDIWDAVKLIQGNALQTALVVDDNRKLLGIVTDGDIRRAILDRMDFNANVAKVMNSKPTVATMEMDISEIRKLMKEKVIHLMPVIDADNIVVDIVFFTDVMNGASVDTPVVLMAGGIGSRLKELTKDRPKPLLNVGNKPLLETILENFIEQGFVNFYFSVNYKSEQIEGFFGDGSRYGVKINYLHEDKALGTAGALYMLPEDISYPVIIMNGDILTKVDFKKLIKFHRKSNSVATMAVRRYTEKIPYGVIVSDNDRIKKIQEKPEKDYNVNAGIYILGEDAIKRIPKNEFYNMTQLFEDMINAGDIVSQYEINDYWIDIGKIEDFEKANMDFGRFFI